MANSVTPTVVETINDRDFSEVQNQAKVFRSFIKLADTVGSYKGLVSAIKTNEATKVKQDEEIATKKQEINKLKEEIDGIIGEQSEAQTEARRILKEANEQYTLTVDKADKKAESILAEAKSKADQITDAAHDKADEIKQSYALTYQSLQKTIKEKETAEKELAAITKQLEAIKAKLG